MLERWIPWIMLAVWSSWAAAAQGFLAHPGRMALWAPDLTLLLFLACAGRFEGRDVPRVAFVVGLGRVAFSIEPAAALLFGFLFSGVLVLWVRSVAEVNGPLMRTVLAFLCGWAFAAWLVLVHVVRVQRMGGASPLPSSFALGLWRAAFTSGVLALLVGPLLAYLPGLTRLRSRRW